MMAGKRFYWLKLQEDFFRQREIKKLRQIAGGDTYVIIYLKLLLLALKTDGKLYFEGIEEDFASEMALEIDEAEENVAVTVNFLIAKGILLSTSPSEYELTTCPEMAGSETDSARRMRQRRNRQSSQCDALPSQCSDVFGNVQKCDLIREETDKTREIGADKPPTRPRFVPPKVEEVREYCTGNGYPIDPERFVDFYTANGWTQGRGKKIKDWRACVRTWAQREKAEHPQESRSDPVFIPDGKGGGEWKL